MTELPVPALERLDAVAVGAADNARVTVDLGLHRCDGLQRRDVRGLAVRVIELKSRVVRVVAAVHAAMCELVLPYPRLHLADSLGALRVDPLLVARRLESPLSPLSALLGSGSDTRWPSPGRAERRAVLGSRALGRERFTALRAKAFRSRRVVPGRHDPILPEMSRATCKPDIFAATYEPTEET